MKVPAPVLNAIRLLNEGGFEAYVVGGSVRNFLRDGSPAHDWDITTSALPEQTAAVFRDFRLIKTGLKHGTVTVLAEGIPLEITTYRVDGTYTDHRRPDSVAFTRSLREDVERRDFTVNALAWHPDEGVVDLVGGEADLRANLIRCVGDPERRFREDSLRILRALRFASVFGMTVEPDTAAALRRCAPLLSHVAAERIREELTRLLCGPHAEAVLLEYHDVLSIPLPEIAPMYGFLQHNPHHDRDVWAHTAAVVAAAPPDPALRWAALLHDVGKPACFSPGADGVGHFYGHAEQSTALTGEILSRLRFDNAGRDLILRLVRYHDQPLAPDRKVVRRLLSKHGPEAALRLIALHKADAMGQSALCAHRPALFDETAALAEELLAEESCFSLKDLAVNGKDMQTLGLRGPQIGAALRACLDAVVEERLPNRREELLSFAAALPR